VSVATQAGCTWSVSNSASWITITAGSSGTGSGNVSYTVASNSGSSARSAGLTIAGQTITVYESGQAPLVLSGSHDFNADGRPDLIWQSQATGQLAYWLMNGVTLLSFGSMFNNQAIDTNWKIVGCGDFSGDGKPDFIWQSQVTGQVRYWLMNGLTLQSYGALNNDLPNDPSWKIVGVFDLDGDGQTDLIWQSQVTGQVAYWLMNGVTLQNFGNLNNGSPNDPRWKIVGK